MPFAAKDRKERIDWRLFRLIYCDFLRSFVAMQDGAGYAQLRSVTVSYA